MSFVETTRELFGRISEAAFSNLRHGEALNLSLYAEDQAYIRFNQARVRQSTSVAQRNLNLTFQSLGREIRFTMDLTGQIGHDLPLIGSLVERARAEVRVLPEDVFLVPMENNGNSDSHYQGSYPPDAEWIAQVIATIDGLDFAGLLSKGPQISAVRNSTGQEHWYSTDSFFVDYSLYTVNDAGENKAVKGFYAGRDWELQQFKDTIEIGKTQLELLKRPVAIVCPGEYRVFLSPSAVEKIIGMFSWGAVSFDAWKKGQSGLQMLIEGESVFSEKFSLRESFLLGLSPRFNSQGELAPMELPIINEGRLENLLVSSRSAKEYSVPSNGADTIGWLGEGLRTPLVSGGGLNEAEALQRLDCGLYLGNLHYLNWSDLHSARITGMTRYACFWVENGEIVAPIIRDLRFDESLYRIFGSCLEDLTAETQLFSSTDTYQRRAFGGMKVPGALLSAFKFTL